jgi:lipopolysaccharide transport system permease protein
MQQFGEIIISGNTKSKNYWLDIWRFRELFYILSWRDIKVRYKQTVIGAAWALLRPLLTMLIFTFVFGRVAALGNESELPYAIIVFAGLLPWQFFSNAFTEASNSLIGNSNLISKVYFPRMIIPASAIITSFVDFVVSFVILLGLMVWYNFVPPINILALPLFILLIFFISFGLGLFTAALNVKYRDFRYVIPFVVQFGIYVSPVGYTSQTIISKFAPTAQYMYYINPVAGIIDGFRWCILNEPLFMPGIAISVATTIIFLLLGIVYFRKTEKSFADQI